MTLNEEQQQIIDAEQNPIENQDAIDEYNNWVDANDYSLMDDYVQLYQTEFTEWCMQSNRELDCPDAQQDFVEVNEDDFEVYCKDQYEAYLRNGGNE